MIPEEAAFERVARFYSEGVPILAHANGDAAAEILIDAVERAAAASGERDHRTVMIHAQTVREDQLDRMSDLAMMPSFFSAHTFYWGDWHRDSVLGPERGSRISPTRTSKDRGMRFTVHNDAPIVPPDMIRLLWATTNRLTRSNQELGPEHALTVHEALAAITVDAAYQYFEEDSKGTIAVGKLADLVVLSRDPRQGDTRDLLDVAVLGTMSHGRWVFDEMAR
jgi:predicted amidohydrolase YtcJ